MGKKNEKRIITQEKIQGYMAYLKEEEKSAATISKYRHELQELSRWLEGKEVTKGELIGWKEHITSRYAPASVNGMLTAMNSMMEYYGWGELKVKLLRIQKSLFSDGKKELTREEYMRLIRAAERRKNERLSLVLQTICATGIRVSELKFITAQAVRDGRAEISSKGKRRVVFLPGKLRRILRKYLEKEKRTAGAVFVTRQGKALDRSNIWREMKSLCKSAQVAAEKVFPHNLRHLFARTYYTLEKDLSRLADILGHSSVETTRIYTIENGNIHARQMERLGLLVTDF